MPDPVKHRSEDLTKQALRTSAQLQEHFRNINRRENKFKAHKLHILEQELQVQQKCRSDERRRQAADEAGRPSSSSSTRDVARTNVASRPGSRGSTPGGRSRGGKKPGAGRSLSTPCLHAAVEAAQPILIAGKSPVNPLGLSRFCASCPVSSHPVPHPGASSLTPHRARGRAARLAWGSPVHGEHHGSPSGACAEAAAAAAVSSASSTAPAGGPVLSSSSTAPALAARASVNPASPGRRKSVCTEAVSPRGSASGSAVTTLAEASHRSLSRMDSSGSALDSSVGMAHLVPASGRPGSMSRAHSHPTVNHGRRASTSKSQSRLNLAFFDRSSNEEPEEEDEDELEKRLQQAVEADMLGKDASQRKSSDPPGSIERLGKLMALLGPRYKTLPKSVLWDKAEFEEEGPTKRRIHKEALQWAAQIDEDARPKPPADGAVRVAHDISMDNDGQARRRWLECKGLLPLHQIVAAASTAESVAGAARHRGSASGSLRGHAHVCGGLDE